MKRHLPGLVIFMVLLGAANSLRAEPWVVTSPDHEQTFAYGTEQSRVWTIRGHRLALLLNFTNDPYVDRDNPRQYDNFTFHFPELKLGSDGHTFYYRNPGGRSVAVAAKRPGFLGVDQIKLLSGTHLVIRKPSGYLTVELVVDNAPSTDNSDQ